MEVTEPLVLDPSLPPMPAPLCLVHNNNDGMLSLNTAALAVLQEVSQPVVVVAIAGPYRSGKSFLMNLLAGRDQGFPLGPTVQAQTKGIWMWCLPHPRQPGVALVLLDTEGLGDPKKGDGQNDVWIFTLALLLSSTLVYNSMGTIDQRALEQLELVTQLSELIRVRDGDGDKDGDPEDEAEDCEFVRFFPGFVWAVRDFTLQLRAGQQELSADEYLEQALALRHGHGRRVQEYNATRQCLRNYFPTRRCFVLPPPLGRELPPEELPPQERPPQELPLEELPRAALSPRFLQSAQEFCEYVLSTSRAKALPDGTTLSGRALCTLLRSYVEAIGCGRLPCLESAAAVLTANENAAAVAAALEAYSGGVQELPLPAEPTQLSAVHSQHLRTALEVFRRRSFRDRDQEHQRQLMEKIGAAYTRLQKANEAASQQHCRALLAELGQELDAGLARGAYTHPGGYREYEAARQQLLDSYQRAEGKGPKAEEVLDEFLKGRRAEAEGVLKADNALSEAEKQLEEQRQRTQLLAQQQKAAEERERHLQALLEDERDSREQSARALEAKLRAEAEGARQELDRALEAKLREHAALLERGFAERAALLEREVAALRREMSAGGARELVTSVFEALRAACDFASAYKLAKIQKGTAV